jgi:succinate-semialdehyde dehydrogenase / glutarate-semialdehyde dehydrogenase
MPTENPDSEPATVLRSTNPRTGDVVGECTDMTADDVEEVVARARTAADAWSSLPVRQRARHLRGIRREWIRRAPELARIDAAETGKSLIDAAYEVLAVSINLDWCSWNARRALRSRRAGTFPTILKRARVEYGPYGVVGIIAPWNYPAGIPMQVIPWVLAAGNTVVLKPSELASQTGILLADIINRSGHELIHVATGGAVAGAAVASSAGIDKIEFTGSGPTAKHVLRAAAENITPVVMELGGKDALIVTDGADVASAARTAVGAAFFNAGQTCMATERVIATPGVHDELVDAIRAETAKVVVGPDPSSHVGPLTMPGSLRRVIARIDDAVADGATLVAGGTRLPADHGDYLEPTVLTDVPAHAEVLTVENFAPVMCIQRARDVDHAIELSNAVDLGLSGSVFASNLAEARSIAERLDTGGVVVGDAMVGASLSGVAFGGVKQSGYGRLQGLDGFREFSRSRAVIEPRIKVSLMATLAGPRPDPTRIFAIARALRGGGGAGPRLRALRRDR